MIAERKTIVTAWAILTLLVGCGGPQPEVALIATQILPQATAVLPTETLSPTDTPILPTLTPLIAATDEPAKPLIQGADYIQGAQMFDEQQALKHVEYLASDELQGRRSGTPGGQKAGDYIAARFAEYGLQPAGSGNTYFQSFTTPYTTIIELPILTVIFPSLDVSSSAAITRTYTYHTDYIPRITGYLGSGEVTGQVVWLGECIPDHLDSSSVRQDHPLSTFFKHILRPAGRAVAHIQYRRAIANQRGQRSIPTAGLWHGRPDLPACFSDRQGYCSGLACWHPIHARRS